MLMSNWMAMKQRVLPIGVDIGVRRVKMVQLAQAEDRLKVVCAERAPLDVDRDASQEERRDAVVRTIKQLLARRGFRGRKSVSALSCDELRITSMRLAETETHQIEKVLRKEAVRRFGLDGETDTINYVLAGSVRQGDEAKNEYIVLAADNEVIKSHISLLENAGLQPAGIDAAPNALFRSFERRLRREEDKQRTIIFVDVGHGHTTVVFGRSGGICFVKQIPLGAARFSEDVASTLGLSVPDAESLRLRLQRAEPVEASTRRSVVDVVTSAAEALAKELSLCLRYHTVTFRGKRVERAVIVGGGAYESILLDVFRRHLSVEIEVGEPLRGFDGGDRPSGEGETCSSADLALAVGLSLKGRRQYAGGHGARRAAREPVLEGERL
ncbi:MAG: pilus assembly protein PilM [Sedimentisphaerales bacterium]|nr:pilus assembly protein PilM [Sedimentisphaerales bacterium]